MTVTGTNILFTSQAILTESVPAQADRDRYCYTSQASFTAQASPTDSVTLQADHDRYYDADQAPFALPAIVKVFVTIRADRGYYYAGQSSFASLAISTDLETIDADWDRYFYAAYLCSHRRQF